MQDRFAKEQVQEGCVHGESHGMVLRTATVMRKESLYRSRRVVKCLEGDAWLAGLGWRIDGSENLAWNDQGGTEVWQHSSILTQAHSRNPFWLQSAAELLLQYLRLSVCKHLEHPVLCLMYYHRAAMTMRFSQRMFPTPSQH
ncbi:hypothetical protein KC333_g106 [Hortaea werneckii]|nr:hypothetical protein KC333_g106 [Hortaea werneckii]